VEASFLEAGDPSVPGSHPVEAVPRPDAAYTQDHRRLGYSVACCSAGHPSYFHLVVLPAFHLGAEVAYHQDLKKICAIKMLDKENHRIYTSRTFNRTFKQTA